MERVEDKFVEIGGILARWPASTSNVMFCHRIFDLLERNRGRKLSNQSL